MNAQQTQRPPATPSCSRWQQFCRLDDPGAATRWFAGTEPPATANRRDPYRVRLLVVGEEVNGCKAGVYLYWPGTTGGSDPVTADEPEEMVGPIRLNGERVLEELWRQHPEADKHEHDTLFEGMVEKMLSDHLVDTCCKLWRHTQESALQYAEIDNWTRKVEDAAEKTRSWRLAHG